MNNSRRQFLMSVGMFGVATELLSQEPASRQGSAQGTQSLPSEATQGAWKNMRAVREKKVVDFHTHSWETKTQATSLRGTGLLHQEGNYIDFSDQLVSSMNQHGIARAALSPMFVGYERYEISHKKHPDKFVKMAGVNAMKPQPSPAEAAKILRTQLSQGAKGIGEGGLPPWKTPQDLKPVMEVAMEFDAPILIHTGWSATVSSGVSLGGSPYRAAWRFAEEMGALASAYPDVKLIMGHIGGRFDWIDGYEALRVAFSFDNIYLETSKSTPRIVTEGVKGLGAEKVIYGSDWNRPDEKTYGPYHMRDVYQQWYNLNVIAQADLTEDQRDMILYKNAIRLLKL